MKSYAEMVQKFSTVIPFRDTPIEREFAKTSIPSAIRLNPDELVIGVDEPADESFLDYIRDLCNKESYANFKIVRVEHSDQWSFQLANVIWHCYNACKNDKILATDIDNVLRNTVLKGYDLIGSNNNGVVSFTKKTLIRNVSDLIRYVFYRLSVRRRSDVFSGIYWVYKPYYFEDVDIEQFKSIRNGIDAYMRDQITEMGRHCIVTLKEIGVESLDYQNEDYPWRQFQKGIWFYANYEKHGKLEIEREQDRPFIYKYVHKILDNHPGLYIRLISYMHQHPYFKKGYFWAKKNPTHESVLVAGKTSRSGWGYLGSKYIKDIYYWERHGRHGTGFG